MRDHRFRMTASARKLVAVTACCLAVVTLAAPTSARRPKSPPSPTISQLTDVNGTLFFVREDLRRGETALWKTDGTTSGTQLVQSFSNFAFPIEFTDVAGTLFFILLADEVELWKSDGTPTGTTNVATLDFRGVFPPFEDEFIDGGPSLQAVGSTLFFVGVDAERGVELWKSDGTRRGTKVVKDIFPGPESSSPAELTAVGDTLYFAARDGLNGFELWKSDGTEAGTQLVKNIRTLGASSFPRHLTPVGSEVFFFAHDTENGLGLWRSNGTDAGTTLVRPFPGISEVTSEVVVAGTTLYFETLSFDPEFFEPTLDLWRSDGTTAGTVVVEALGFDFEADPFLFGELEPVGTDVFVVRVQAETGAELWKTTGSGAGTALVRDIRRGVKSSSPVLLHGHGDSVFFAANDGKRGYEPWVSDGSASGTKLLKNIAPGDQSSFPFEFASSAGKVFFTTVTRAGTGLWATDGTRAGTIRLASNDPLRVRPRR